MRTDLQDIVDDVSHLLSAPTILEDRDFNLVAFGSQAPGIDQVRQQSILERRCSPGVQRWFEQFGIATSDHPVRTPADPERGVLARVCLPARWNGITYGYLWLLDEPHRIDDSSLGAAMHRAARAGAVMAQQARSHEHLGETVHELFSTDPATVDAAATEIAEFGPIGRNLPIAVVVLQLAASPPSATWPVKPMNLWRLPRAVVASPAADHTALVVPLATPADLRPAKDIARHARDLCAERLDETERPRLVAGIGAPRPDLTEARASWREARLSARISATVTALRPVASWPELGIYRLLACGPQQELQAAVADPAVHALLENADADLVRTATTYLDRAGNVRRTAAELGIHRQTLYYRLQKIEQLTGLDFADGQDRLRLHLGLTLAPLLNAPDRLVAPGSRV